ncbi:MAG: hypothetical protein BWX84_00303 [Verrucomicrobia bacterium ADurb.Bin118]|nr:MAG: hypothetical protein BWX84_00303 [Verrucomicrobia bacterium ADurb.Bin118]
MTVTAIGAAPRSATGVRFVTIEGVVTRKMMLVMGASAWRYSFHRAVIHALISVGLTAETPWLTNT